MDECILHLWEGWGGDGGEEVYITLSERSFECEMTPDLCLDHVVPMFPHTADKAPDVNDMVSLQLVEAVVDGQYSATATHTCTAVNCNRTGLGWVRGVYSP